MPRLHLALSIIAVSTLALPVVQAAPWTLHRCNFGFAPGPGSDPNPKECCTWSGDTAGVFMRGCAALVLRWLCPRQRLSVAVREQARHLSALVSVQRVQKKQYLWP
jgi:hypothetical protein